MHTLLIEDDVLLSQCVAKGLRLHQMTVDVVNNAARARAAMAASIFDVCILDLGLPDENGIDLLQSWRHTGITLPILILSAQDSISSRIKGLQSGADDYLPKPFDLDELCARLQALVRRASGNHHDIIHHGELRYQASTAQVWLHGTLIDLPRRELTLLRTFLHHPHQLISTEQLHNSLYGFDINVESNAVNVHIHHLRQKLGPHIIETIRGIGYRLGMAKS